ncbi:MAG: N-6 DNA methylase [Candidatus Thiodiazotropha lotti]|nr:N-6 DNA methylase [Candidatus Thiodiazotropha lotti]MCW4184863.1 N-6 DNA methylase [Candidatus Thiodiazotropha weberae]
MEKNQAQQSITQLFTTAFDRERYLLFLRNLLNQYEIRDVHYTGNYIPDAFKQHVKQYWRVGKYVDPEGDELDLLVVQVKTLNKLERARSALRNFAVNRLKQFEKEASLVAFYAEDDQGEDWRFSFIKIEHEAYQNDKGKVKLKQELTPAKRYSYLVGVHENSHTASKQLLPLLEMDYADPRIKEIEAVFSIEKVTNEFFDQYKALFQKLAEHLKKQAKGNEEEMDQHVSRFAKKLLGQIVFLYFLQKKGWLGVPKDGRWGAGSKRFMRERFDLITKGGGNYYHDFLQYLFYEALADERKDQGDPGYYARFDCRVPFLNGGLFEAGYDWRNETIDLPNTLFHNNEKTKNGDKGTGILNVFDRYNFTVKEDEPLEKEVAVDPEMLGKVFENMLEVTERKSKGAFYTPREIVHYMCQESLIHYLDNRLNTYATAPEQADQQGDIFDSSQGQQSLEAEEIKVPKADLETLIRKGHLALENDTRVLNKGRETDTYMFQLPKSVRQHAKQIDEALASITVCDPAIGSGAFPVGLLHELVNARLALAPHSGNDQTPYELKRHVIAENHYGVDIDPSAIDIARLRLWLSLIVEEEDFDEIEALPNLDYKIVCGDSLIGFPKEWSSPAFKKIEEMKKKFFEETNHERKVALKSQIDKEIQQRLDGSKRTFGYQVDFDFRLLFSEIWHKKDGFDVVIGNPPYVFGGSGVLTKESKVYFKKAFFSGKGKVNLFALFIEKGIGLLKEKGTLSYIIPNTLLRVTSYSSAREFIVKNSLIKEIVDLDVGVFNKVTASTIIIQLLKPSSLNVRNSCSVKKGIEERSYQEIPQSEFNNKGYVFDIFSSKSDRLILKTLGRSSEALGAISSIIRFGVVISGNHDEVVSSIKNNDEWKPFLEGDEIGAYSIKYRNRFLHYKKELLHRSRTPEIFEQRKIMIQRITGGANPVKATYDESGYYNKESIINLLLNDNVFEYTYVLAILNSELINWFYAKRFTNFSKLTVNLSKEYLSEIPIFQAVDEVQSQISCLVEYVLFIEPLDMSLYSAYFEQVINGLVYELYFPDEIKAADKEILPHLGSLTQISDDMAKEEKLAVIQRAFDRLYDPRHPVRNHLETLDSVEVVGTIREALQRK